MKTEITDESGTEDESEDKSKRIAMSIKKFDPNSSSLLLELG